MEKKAKAVLAGAARAGTSARLARFSAMAFLPASDRADPEGLIFDPAEAARARAIEAERIREAQAMVARFFGLPDTASS